MTSRKKVPVSSFGHVSSPVAVMHLPTKFCANSSIQFAVIDISEIQDGGRCGWSKIALLHYFGHWLD